MKIEELEALAEKATKGVLYADDSQANRDLLRTLANHRREIIALVKAAKSMRKMSGSCQRALEQSGMNAALAAFEEK